MNGYVNCNVFKNGFYYSSKKINEWTTATSINRDESHKQNIEWKRQLTEEYIQNNAIYIKLKIHKTK